MTNSAAIYSIFHAPSVSGSQPAAPAFDVSTDAAVIDRNLIMHALILAIVSFTMAANAI